MVSFPRPSITINFKNRGLHGYVLRLSHATNTSGQKIIETTANEVNSSILEQLKALATEYKLQAQLGVILNAASSSINLEQENKFYFSQIYIKYDNDSRRFLPGMSCHS